MISRPSLSLESPADLVPDPRFVHFFGLKRSGNHAVIHWLAEGLKTSVDQPVIHFNNVAGGRPKPHKEMSHINQEIAGVEPGTVILSYEDVSYSERRGQKHYTNFSGGNNADVLILRSFPNMMASRFQRIRNIEEQGGASSVQRLGFAAARDLWIEYAQHVLGSDETNLTGVLYDKWFKEKEYRDEIGSRWGFDNQDLGIDYVPNNALGSSFDGTSFQGRAQDMRTLDRWQAIADDAEHRYMYATLVTRQVVELNEQLFGLDQPTMI
ncbi:MAG TPA: hypothetical protein VK674_03290 [Candidatus Limnocylindria bacterium]|nr:hypothetical protein [Candidatus Limnocylindria bacterium]